jgi:CHAT domain
VSIQLVIHDDQEVVTQATIAIKRALGVDANVICHSNFEDAMAVMRDPETPCSLVVLGSTAPRSPSAGFQRDSAPARDFIRTIRKTRNVPVIALVVTEEPTLSGLLSAWDNTALIQYTADWRDSLEERARLLYNKLPLGDSLLELQIELHEQQDSGDWRVQCRGSQEFTKSGGLVINSGEFRSLVTTSEAMAAAGDEWRSFLAMAGDQLERLLFSTTFNNGLSKTFFMGLGAVGGLERVRIVFTLPPTRQPAMVEALREEPGSSDFWMLKAPIVRQYNTGRKNRPLFVDDATRSQPINCLVINANPAAGRIDTGPWAGEYRALPQIRNEALGVEAILSKAKAAGVNIGTIRRLDLSTPQDNYLKALIRELGSEVWHLVHFAGHGVVSQQKSAGLLLDAAPDAVMPFETFANKLSNAQFLFVSACRSANQSFIMKAIDSTMPAVLGYRWPVNDLRAAQFAVCFYDGLFTAGKPSFRSLEYAFLAARRATHEQDPDDNTWASPLLLAQLHFDND